MGLFIHHCPTIFGEVDFRVRYRAPLRSRDEPQKKNGAPLPVPCVRAYVLVKALYTGTPRRPLREYIRTGRTYWTRAQPCEKKGGGCLIRSISAFRFRFRFFIFRFSFSFFRFSFFRFSFFWSSFFRFSFFWFSFFVFDFSFFVFRFSFFRFSTSFSFCFLLNNTYMLSRLRFPTLFQLPV